jgi:hypothetical protein
MKQGAMPREAAGSLQAPREEGPAQACDGLVSHGPARARGPSLHCRVEGTSGPVLKPAPSKDAPPHPSPSFWDPCSRTDFHLSPP